MPRSYFAPWGEETARRLKPRWCRSAAECCKQHELSLAAEQRAGPMEQVSITIPEGENICDLS